MQRWLNFTKYLPEKGWKPIVYTPENPDFEIQDDSLLQEVNPEVEVIKRPIWEPYKLHQLVFGKKQKKGNKAGLVESGKSGYWSNWIRGNLFVPDPKIFWRKPSVRFLSDYLKRNKIDAIISTGTPHSMHLIALSLKRKFPQIPWVADFRDPWTELDMLKSYHIHPLRMKKYRSYEKSVLKMADLCITTSKVWANDFERLGARKCIAITNGYDERDFEQEVKPYTQFVISHFGLLNHLRNPSSLWNALEALCAENQTFREKFELHLGGTISSENLAELKNFTHLKKAVKVFPYLSHKEVVKEYLKSSVLLLLLFNSESGKGNIPGKLFEYLAARRPILAFGPDKGDSAQIIEDKQAGSFFLYEKENVTEIKKAVWEAFQLHQNGEVLPARNGISMFSRRATTAALAEHLNSLT